MQEDLFCKKDTDFIRDNTLINYCLYGDEPLFLKSFIHNNGIDLKFDEEHYHCFMTGTHRKFLDRYTQRMLREGVEDMLKVYELLLGEMDKAGYVGNILLAKPDNSKQIVMFFSPTDRAVCSPEELANRLRDRYVLVKDPYPGVGPEYTSTSFSGPYRGYECMRQAFVDVRTLNDLIFFGVRDRVITESYRSATARPLDICAIFINFRRFLNTVCTGTLNQSLRQAKTMIDDLVAPSYSMTCFGALYISCEDMFSMFETCYPDDIRIDRRSMDSFNSLADYHVYLSDRLRAIYAQLRDRRRYPATILMALSFINRNYTSDISLAQIAEYVYANMSTFSSDFNAALGESLSEYVSRLRIDHAKRLLRETPLGMVDVAHQSGFSSVKYFREVFKKQTGLTPQRFRNG